ncbi:MAG: serine/threonine-protein kinase [Planctomycetota bacterium]
MPGDVSPRAATPGGETPRNRQASNRTGGVTSGGSRKRVPIDLGRLAEHTELMERIGRGGYGEVWRVKYLGSEEAWKFIPVAAGEDNQALKEAVHARRVEHRNVVKVHDITRQGNHHILRMDLVRGRDLFRVVMDDGVIPPDQAVGYMLQVAEALRRAHEQEVVHLDLKPHNLLLRDDGSTVMVTDFGISSFLVKGLAVDQEAGRGTPYFLAPEQATPEGKVGRSADIWSFGVTLYFLLSRQYPFDFERKDPVQVITQESVVPLATRIPWSPPDLEAIIAQCLMKDPIERFGSMAELVNALEGWLRRLRCPSCGQEANAEVAGSRCLAASCQSPELGVLKESVARLRAADRCFALCQYGEAREQYARVTQATRAAEASRKSAAAAQCEREEEQAVAAITAMLDAGQMLDTFRAVRQALVTLSRSPRLRELERRVEEQMAERFQNARARVEGFLRQANFVEARKYLTVVDGILADGAARSVVLANGDEDAGTPTGFSAMYATIEERERAHGTLSRGIQAAIAALNFVEAGDLLGRMQGDFPSTENLDRMRQLKRAADIMRTLESYPPFALQSLASGKFEIAGTRALELARADRLCSELLAQYSPESYPRMQEIVERREQIEAAIKAIRAHGDQALATGRQFLDDGHADRARQRLELAQDIILKTDLFKQEQKDDYGRMLTLASERASRAEEMYREGCRSEEQRQFSKALTAFEEVQRLDPDRYLDLTQHVAACQEKAALRLKLSEASRPLLVQLTSEEPDNEVLEQFLDLAAKLDKLQDDTARVGSQQELADVLSHFLSLAHRRLASASTAQDRLNQLERTMLPLAHVTDEYWRDLLVRHTQVTDRITELAVKSADLPSPLSSNEAMLQLEQVARLWSIAGPGLRQITTAAHPALLLATAARAAVERARGAGRVPLCHQAVRLIDEQLDPLGSPDVKAQLADLRNAIQRLARRSELRVVFDRLTRTIGRNAITIVAAALFLFLGMTLARRLDARSRVRAFSSTLERLVPDQARRTQVAAELMHAPEAAATLAAVERAVSSEAPFELRVAQLAMAWRDAERLPNTLKAAATQPVIDALTRASDEYVARMQPESGSLTELASRFRANQEWLGGLLDVLPADLKIVSAANLLVDIDQASLQLVAAVDQWQPASKLPQFEPAAGDALAGIAPNLARAAARLGLDRLQRAVRTRLRWLTIHPGDGDACEQLLSRITEVFAQLVARAGTLEPVGSAPDGIDRAIETLRSSP